MKVHHALWIISAFAISTLVVGCEADSSDIDSDTSQETIDAVIEDRAAGTD